MVALGSESKERVESRRIENPWKDYVFAQICGMVPDGEDELIFACAEPFFRVPFPGGCWLEKNNYLGTGSCNIAAGAAYPINLMVPPETILEKTGYPGLTPDMIAWMIYPQVVSGFQMTCYGAGVELLYPTLRYFGLQPETVYFSEFTLPDLVDKLPKDQLMIVALQGYKWNADRTQQLLQHYTVAKQSAALPNGYRTFQGPDSYYYLKLPTHPTNVIRAFNLSQEQRHKIVVLASSIIRNNPNNPSGKDAWYAGAYKVIPPKSWGDIKPIYVEPLSADRRVGQRHVRLPSDFATTGKPFLIGPDRWEVEVIKGDKKGYFYYYSDEGEKYPFGEEFTFRSRYGEMPAFMQLDPRWGPVGSGQAITASLLSANGGEDGGEITPYGVHQKYFGGRWETETQIGKLVPIWEQGEYRVAKISGIDAIYDAVGRGEMVVLQGRVNFAWWNAKNEEVDRHYQLFWGLSKEGNLLVYDPLWGVIPVRRQELQFYKINAMYSLNKVFTSRPPR